MKNFCEINKTIAGTIMTIRALACSSELEGDSEGFEADDVASTSSALTRTVRLTGTQLEDKVLSPGLVGTQLMIDTTRSSPPIASTVRTCRQSGDYIEAC